LNSTTPESTNPLSGKQETGLPSGEVPPALQAQPKEEGKTENTPSPASLGTSVPAMNGTSLLTMADSKGVQSGSNVTDFASLPDTDPQVNGGISMESGGASGRANAPGPAGSIPLPPNATEPAQNITVPPVESMNQSPPLLPTGNLTHLPLNETAVNSTTAPVTGSAAPAEMQAVDLPAAPPTRRR
jgi:hypothetical protein